MKKVTIDGKEYILTPVEPSEEKSTPQNLPDESAGTILNDYEGVKVAQPGIYDWKKELAKKMMKNMENAVLKKKPRTDTDMDKFGDLVVGPGVEQEW